MDSFKTEVWALWDAVRHMDDFMRPRTISLRAGERWVPRYEDYITKERDWVDKDYDTKAISEELTRFTKFTSLKKFTGKEDRGGEKVGLLKEVRRRKEDEDEERGKSRKKVKFEAALEEEEGKEQRDRRKKSEEKEKRKSEDEINERETRKFLKRLGKEDKRGTKRKNEGEEPNPSKTKTTPQK